MATAFRGLLELDGSSVGLPSGTGAASFQAQTASGAGVVSYIGSGAANNTPQTASGSGSVLYTGIGAAIFSPQTASGTDQILEFTGTGAATFAPITADGTDDICQDFNFIARFGKSIQEWASADAALVALTGHTSNDRRIFVSSRRDPVVVPCLIIDIGRTFPFFFDNAQFMQTQVEAVAIGRNRREALDIANEIYKRASRDRTTYKDASFSGNCITTRGLIPVAFTKEGESEFDISSLRRTERSDTPIPERHIAKLALSVVWQDDA